MKVIYSIGAHFATTGISSVAYREVKTINNKRYLKRLLCLDYKKTEILTEKIKSFWVLKYLIWFPLKGIQRYFFHSFNPYNILDNLYDRLAKIRVEKCDIFHYWRGHGRLSSKRAKELGAVTFVQNASSHPRMQNDLISEEYKLHGIHSEPVSERSLKYAERELEDADYVVVPSDFAEKSFIDKGFPKEKIIKIPFGVDLEKFSSQKNKKDDLFRVIFVGQVNLRKGVQYLLKAWQELNLKNAELLIVGRIMPDAEELVKKYQDNQSIKFIGFTDLKKYYASSDIFVFPSIEEGSALVNYEAMACGLPVITTYNSGSVVRNNKDGFIIPIRDVNALRNKIKYFYENPQQIKIMGRNARKNVEKYTWERHGLSLIKNYEKSLAKRRLQR
jgi:glycosyltransferase involved in cell wall biosynthesis